MRTDSSIFPAPKVHSLATSRPPQPLNSQLLSFQAIYNPDFASSYRPFSILRGIFWHPPHSSSWMWKYSQGICTPPHLVTYWLTVEKPWIPNRSILQLWVHNVFMIKLPITQYSTIWLHPHLGLQSYLLLLLATHDPIHRLFCSPSSVPLLNRSHGLVDPNPLLFSQFKATPPHGPQPETGRMSFLFWWERALSLHIFCKLTDLILGVVALLCLLPTLSTEWPHLCISRQHPFIYCELKDLSIQPAWFCEGHWRCRPSRLHCLGNLGFYTQLNDMKCLLEWWS